MTDMQAAKALGWFSLALGAAEVLTPNRLGKQIGVGEHSGLMRTFGAREILTGVGVLSRSNPVMGMWARVAGDALDLTMLGAGIKDSNRRKRVAVAVGMIAMVALADVFVARRLQS